MAASGTDALDANEHVQKVANAFQEGIALKEEDIGPVCARVVRGSKPQHFEKLSKDAWKKFSWCIGPDGLEILLRGDISLLEKFRLFGFTDEWLEKKLSDGEEFKLAIFPATSAPQATWDGIFELVKTSYSSVSEKVMKYSKELRETAFEDIEKECPFHPHRTYHDIFEDEANRSTDDHFINLEKLEKIDNPELWQVRSFLYNQMGLKELFEGAGHTKTESGERGMKEFLTPNKPMKDILHLHLADFALTFDAFKQQQKALAKES